MRFAVKRRKLLLASAACIVFIFAAAGIFSFNWPQNNAALSAISFGFAELKGKIMSQSLIFDAAEIIKPAERGVIVAVLKTPDSDSSLFHSTLGNAVIINHGDELVSVYGNLETTTLDGGVVESDSVIGVSGSSGWHKGQAGLEFQIIDIKNHKALNPRTLMPRFESELPLSIPAVIALNKQNESFLLGSVRQIPAGQYKLYLQNGASPYRTTVFVNGAVNETITYDALTAHKETGKLTIQGKNPYTAHDMYLSSINGFPRTQKHMYLSTIVLAHGRNTIRVLVSDINNVERQAVFSVDVN
jgi:hypothetical protein